MNKQEIGQLFIDVGLVDYRFNAKTRKQLVKINKYGLIALELLLRLKK